MLNRTIPQEKLDVLLELYQQINGKEIIQNVSYSTSQADEVKHEKAMIVVANAMLNLDEFLMKN